VTNGYDGGVSGCQTDTGDVPDCGSEVTEQFLLFDIEDGGLEHVTRVEDLLDDHTVCERGDVQHVEESGFRGTDLGGLVNEMDFVDNFNRTTGNLSGHTESYQLQRQGYWRYPGRKRSWRDRDRC